VPPTLVATADEVIDVPVAVHESAYDAVDGSSTGT
jgi:hypothetical protein